MLSGQLTHSKLFRVKNAMSIFFLSASGQCSCSSTSGYFFICFSSWRISDDYAVEGCFSMQNPNFTGEGEKQCYKVYIFVVDDVSNHLLRELKRVFNNNLIFYQGTCYLIFPFFLENSVLLSLMLLSPFYLF